MPVRRAARRILKSAYNVAPRGDSARVGIDRSWIVDRAELPAAQQKSVLFSRSISVMADDISSGTDAVGNRANRSREINRAEMKCLTRHASAGEQRGGRDNQTKKQPISFHGAISSFRFLNRVNVSWMS